jgi:hypothetical protein
MPQRYEISAAARGEPMRAGQVGARIRVPLSGAPSAEWSRRFTSHLATSLNGHPAIGHLHIGTPVQGAEIILEGVELAEAERLGQVLLECVDHANRFTGARTAPAHPNIEQAEADRIAAALALQPDGISA